MEIIILTGFEEFEYAKEAISLGVAKYLLKPISYADFLQAANKALQWYEMAGNQGEKEVEKKEEQKMILLNG